MSSRSEILDAALDVLRDGETLTLDAVARTAGLTKPGVVHYFPTKEALAHAVVDWAVDAWEAELLACVGAHADQRMRLRAYVEYALLGDTDPADLAFLADARLRVALTEQWARRVSPWVGSDSTSDPRAQAVRLLADGAWLHRALGTVTLTEAQRRDILAVALDLIEEARP